MKNRKIKAGTTVKMLTVAAGIVGFITMIINDRLEDAKLEDIKEAARNEAREEIKKHFQQ